VKALFASPLSFAASILSSSDTGSKLRPPSSGDGTEDGGVDVDAAEDEESLMSEFKVNKFRTLDMISESAFFSHSHDDRSDNLVFRGGCT
jgi:hypothetical protein